MSAGRARSYTHRWKDAPSFRGVSLDGKAYRLEWVERQGCPHSISGATWCGSVVFGAMPTGRTSRRIPGAGLGPSSRSVDVGETRRGPEETEVSQDSADLPNPEIIG
jgi:hypothetical protein